MQKIITAAALASALFLASAAAAQATRSASSLDAALTHAVGEAVLPESLGTTARAAASAAFLAWIADYRPVSEEMHGYGDAEITYTAADPAVVPAKLEDRADNGRTARALVSAM